MDVIADFLTRIRNAKEARHRFVDVRYSKIKKAIADVMKDSHFIEKCLVDEDHRKLRIFLKYSKDKRSIISGLKRLSKPGVRHYVGWDKIPVIRRGLGIAILSTPKGIIDGQKAREQKLGGELICYVW